MICQKFTIKDCHIFGTIFNYTTNYFCKRSNIFEIVPRGSRSETAPEKASGKNQAKQQLVENAKPQGKAPVNNKPKAKPKAKPNVKEKIA